jgi:hypothetical protein
MYLRATHGKQASELLAFLEQATPEEQSPPEDLRCLGRTYRCDLDDQDHWEWFMVDYSPAGNYIYNFGRGSALMTAGDLLTDLIRHPEHWHMGRQPFDSVTGTYGDFVPDDVSKV